jgi:drug/metabolite transporter (DMT)-like permease
MRRQGLVLIVLSNLCFSTGGLWARTIATPPDGYEIVFWRSIAMIVALTLVLSVQYGRDTPAKFQAIGLWGIVSAACLAMTFFAFILSVMRTTVANTTLTMAMAPFFTAIAGLLFLREPIGRATWLVMAIAVCGLAVMLVDSLSGDGLVGIVFALGVPLGLAGQVVINRRFGVHTDMVPAVIVAGLISIAIALPLAMPLTASASDIAVILGMGIVQLSGGCFFLTLAMRRMPAAEIGLYTLLETVLGPLWVWLAYGEQPANLALLGGALIVGALLINSVASLRHVRT